MLDAAGVGPERLFIVPGNHDLDRDAFELMPEALLKPFTTEEQIQEWLTNGKKRNRLLEPFEEYNKFLKPYANGKLSAYGSLCRFEAEEKKIALLCLNSALMCGRNKNGKGETDDYGKLILGEHQVYEALGNISDADICFAVMHHQFDFFISIIFLTEII